MKKQLTILGACLALFAASAQVQYINTGTNVDDHTGELIGHNTWLKLNYDFSYLDAEASNNATALASYTNNPQNNMVQTSAFAPLLVSNVFVFTGSNNLGWFTNIYSFTSSVAPNLTNMMSIDGSTWTPFAFTNPVATVVGTNFYTNDVVYNYLTTTNIGTNTYYLSHLGTNFITNSIVFTNLIPAPIKLAVLSSGTSTGAVSVLTVSPFNLVGKYNSFSGQTLDFGGATVTGLPPGLTMSNVANSAIITAFIATNAAIRFGEVSIANLATTTTVTFSTPYPVGITNYVVLITTAGFATFPSAMYANRTTNGFDIQTASVAGGGKASYWTRY